MMVYVTAQPMYDYDPDDPVEIMRVLPTPYHEQFLVECEAAVASARRPEEYRQLHHVLRLWRLRAAAYAEPGFEARLESARIDTGGNVLIEEIVPDWDERVAAARRRRAGE
jgi:hypothetical protein